MERAWMIASIVCLLVATIFLLRAQQEAAFVIGTLGVVAWFLSYRERLRASRASTETNDDEDEGSGDMDDE